MTDRSDALAIRAAATAQVVVDDLSSPVLSSEDEHHLGKVLRLRAGESVIATDGLGAWVPCMWRGDALEAAGEVRTEPETREVAIAFALTKGDKPEWTVQKLTEIGVTHISAFTSAHTVVKWDAAKRERNVTRWRRIAYEAAMQSRRVRLPIIDDIRTLDELVPLGFVLAAPGGGRISPNVDRIAIGPEGGWAPHELEAAADHIDLGPTILRAETAAVAAAVRMCARL